VAALKAAERRAWQRKALNKGPAARFETRHLTDDEAQAIRDALAGATGAAAIKAAFAVKAEPVEDLIGEVWGDAVAWARLAMRED
jgi:hypothetical protein